MDKRHYEKFADGSVKDIEDEIPFDVPAGWSWCRLYHTCSVIMGQSPEGSSISNNQNELEFHQGKIFFTDIYLAESGIYTSEITKIAPENSLLLCVRAPVGVVNITKREICIGRGLCAIKPNYVIDEKFWFYWIQCQKTDFEQKATGTTFKAISVDIIKQQLIPLPPLSEQQLIVAEIEKIFAQIDLLEQNKTDLQTAIKQAKSKILDLAIHGKLVPQDPNDESASVLLEKIRAEKEAKIAKGELKRDKIDSYIYKSTTDNCHYEKINGIEEELPFNIPNNWQWCRLGEICELCDGEKINKKLPYLDAKHFRNKGTDYVEFGKFVKANTYLILVDGENSGEIFFTSIDGIQGSTFKILNIQDSIYSHFILYFIRKNQLLLRNSKVGSAIPHLNKKMFKELFLPLPPIAEQQRIVAKIEELISLLDQIQTNLI